MGESERNIGYRKLKIAMGADGNALMTLISINAIFLLLYGLFRSFIILYNLPPVVLKPIFYPCFYCLLSFTALVQKPWTLFSYMFTHTGVISVITNMLWLWAFGSILQSIAGNRKLIPIYLYGGIAGAVAFVAANYLIPSLKPGINFSFLHGANAATMAIAVATTALAPDYRFLKCLMVAYLFGYLLYYMLLLTLQEFQVPVPLIIFHTWQGHL
ncbi:MAG: rhomboid family intramembrane serine protease [Chitinophagaceae bacterium]